MNIVTIVFQLLVCLSSLLAAVVITFRPPFLEPLTTALKQTGLRRLGQSALHWIALIANFFGMMVPFLAFFTSCLAFISIVPLLLRARRLKVMYLWPLPMLLAIGSVGVAITQPLGLKVLALPKADELAFDPTLWRVVKTYDEGLWFEGIAAGADGTLYLSGNRGLDFSITDYYRSAQGELIERKPDGSERILFRTPVGITCGVPVVAPDSSLFLTSHGDRSFLWHIEKRGVANRFAQFPSGAWPNGLDVGPDGMLYSVDSNLGVIWRVNRINGEVEVALSDHALQARPFISLAPGGNGLHFQGRELLVTVSDGTVILKYVMDDQGDFGPASIIADGIPGDDFAIGADGSLFVTTHPYNTLVRVLPNGERSVLAKDVQHVVGATDAVFGKTAADRNTLYVVTDGGAFTGGAKTRGELIALEPYSN